MKSGQTRSHFEVDLFKQNWSLSASGFDSEFNNGIFIFVDCLELPKIAIKILSYVVFVFLGNLVTKNLRIASKFDMEIANTGLHNMYSGFLNYENFCFL